MIEDYNRKSEEMRRMVEKLGKDLDLKSSVLKEIMKNEMKEEMDGAFQKNTFVKTGFD